MAGPGRRICDYAAPMNEFVDWIQNFLQTVPHFGTGLLVVWAGYLVILSSWIVLQKREPVATLSWVLSLAALPFLGFFIYYLFGPQRIKRQRLKRLCSRAALES